MAMFDGGSVRDGMRRVRNDPRGLFVDRPDAGNVRFRQRRWAWLEAAFPDLGDMTVVDLGGTVDAWRQAPLRPGRVHVVNIEPQPDSGETWLHSDVGDACDLPGTIATGGYDLVYSNSVIEHVGGHERRLRFAESVHSLAPAHWVQTPNRYFPVEPHWVAPLLQFVPLAARVPIARHWPLSPFADDPGRSDAEVLWTELLGQTQLRSYFPTSTVLRERLGGLTKSLIATAGGKAAAAPPT